MIPSEGRLDVKVYYEDTDSLGVVYYANYLKYLERGRTELIDGMGRSIADWNRDGFNFAVYKANLTFLAPARLGDRCTVVTRVAGGSPYRMRMNQTLEKGDETITKAEIHLVCLDGELKLREFPPEMIPDEG